MSTSAPLSTPRLGAPSSPAVKAAGASTSSMQPVRSRAVRVTATTRIDRPPEDVFDMVADLRNDAQWNSRVSSAELRSPEPIGLGSRFAIVNGGTEYDVTITSYDRPSRLGFEASGNPDL